MLKVMTTPSDEQEEPAEEDADIALANTEGDAASEAAPKHPPGSTQDQSRSSSKATSRSSQDDVDETGEAVKVAPLKSEAESESAANVAEATTDATDEEALPESGEAPQASDAASSEIKETSSAIVLASTASPPKIKGVFGGAAGKWSLVRKAVQSGELVEGARKRLEKINKMSTLLRRASALVIEEKKSTEHRKTFEDKTEVQAEELSGEFWQAPKNALEEALQPSEEVARPEGLVRERTKPVFSPQWTFRHMSTLVQKSMKTTVALPSETLEDPSAPKVIVQRVWRDLKKRVAHEHVVIRERYMDTLQAITNQVDPTNPDSGHVLHHARKALLSRMERLAKLERELKVLGYNGADAKAKPELNPSVSMALRREPNRRDARSSLHMPLPLMNIMDEDGSMGHEGHRHESSLLAVCVQQAQNARYVRKRRAAAKKALQMWHPEKEIDSNPAETIEEVLAKRQMTKLGRPTLLPYMVDDIREKLGLGGTPRLPKLKEGQVEDVHVDAGDMEIRRRQTVRVSTGEPETFALTQEAASPPEAAKPSEQSPRSRRSLIQPGLPMEARGSVLIARKSAMLSVSLEADAECREKSNPEPLSPQVRLSKWGQQSHLHAVVEESSKIISDARKSLDYTREIDAAVLQEVRKELELLANSCSAFTNQAGTVAAALGVAKGVAIEARVLQRTHHRHAENKAKRTKLAQSPRSASSKKEVEERPAWLEKFWQVSASFAKLDSLDYDAFAHASEAIENVRDNQDSLVVMLREARNSKAALDCDLMDVDLASCFEDELEEAKVEVFEIVCRVFSYMAEVVLTPEDEKEPPKTIGQSLFKPQSSLHSGAKVRWNPAPQQLRTWAMDSPLQHGDLEDAGAPQHGKRMYMRRGISGWTCLHVERREAVPP